jgi:capsular exopolysaccharide synthesis family protein
MTQLWRVLQQAERDRALKDGASRRHAEATPVSVAVTTSPAPADTPATRTAPGHRTRFEKPVDAVEGHLVSLLYPASFLAEPYREVRHLLEQLHRTAHLSIVAVASASVGEGKTTTSINVAGALAQAPDSRVLLVDADLRNSSIARHLALRDANGRGLVDAILDPHLGLDGVVISLPSFNLDVVPAGALPRAPYEILKSPRLGELLEEARRRYDFVVLDTAPLVPVPDSRLISKWVDGVLGVVAAHRTPRKLVAELLNLMDPTKVVGLVFNGDDDASVAALHGYPPYGASLAGDRPSWWRSIWRGALPSAGGPAHV